MSSSFRVEKLEDRILLAGNITAVQSGSQLVINGDADDNVINITNDGGAGTIEVSEVDGGTVNGGGPATFAGITHIVVRGRAGDDGVMVDDIDIDGNLTIQLNQGDDVFAVVQESAIGGNVALSADGDDAVNLGIALSNVGGSVQFTSRGGADDLALFQVGIGGQVVINAGHGFNAVDVTGVDVAGKFVVNDGADNLNLNLTDVLVGSTLNIDAGARGDSNIILHDIGVGGQMWIRTGDGEDFVHVCHVEVDLGTVIALRESDDILEVGDSTFHSHFQASGGPHQSGDEIVDLDNNTFDVDPIITRFETFSFGEGCGIDM